jgi:hypothetical protein
MKPINPKINEAIKDAVAAVRRVGEHVEVWWQYDRKTGLDEPWCQDKHGAWSGDLSDTKALRRWISKHGLDGRVVVIYCRGELREVCLAA